jgi:hypothetical protein
MPLRLLPLLPDGLNAALRVCAPICFTASRPTWFREYLACRLADRRPDLAAKVRRLREEDVDRLYGYVQEHRTAAVW